MRVLWTGLIATAALLGFPTPLQPTSEPECAVRELSRRLVTDPGGHPASVEPYLFSSNRGSLLLAGNPIRSYVQGRTPPHVRRGSDSILGLIIPGAGRSRWVRSPFENRRLGPVRALARGDGGWDVIFAETFEWGPEAEWRPDSAIHVWHGVLRPRGWASLDTIPIGALHLPRHWQFSSQPVRLADTLYWAYVGHGMAGGVHLLRYQGGAWHAEQIPSTAPAYVDLAVHDSAGLLAAIVAIDPGLRVDSNSLFLYGRAPEWRELRRLALGAQEPAHHPTFTGSPESLDLTWRREAGRGRQARALAGVPAADPAAAVTVDASLLSLYSPQPVVTQAGSRIWVTPHSDRSIHFTTLDQGEPRLVERQPSPFQGSVRATGIGGARLALLGYVEPGDSMTASMIVRMEVRGCGRRARANGLAVQ